MCRREWLEVGLEMLVEAIVGRLQAAALELWDPTLWSQGHCGQGGGTAWPWLPGRGLSSVWMREEGKRAGRRRRKS